MKLSLQNLLNFDLDNIFLCLSKASEIFNSDIKSELSSLRLLIKSALPTLSLGTLTGS